MGETTMRHPPDPTQSPPIRPRHFWILEPVATCKPKHSKSHMVHKPHKMGCGPSSPFSGNIPPLFSGARKAPHLPTSMCTLPRSTIHPPLHTQTPQVLRHHTSLNRCKTRMCSRAASFHLLRHRRLSKYRTTDASPSMQCSPQASKRPCTAGVHTQARAWQCGFKLPVCSAHHFRK